MSHVFHRNPAHVYPMAVSGDGAYLIDGSGKRYLDASGGAAVSCLGHSDHDVTAAIKAQLDRLAFAHTSFFTNSPMEMLATELVGRAPKGIGYAYFVSGGSEAVESALKLARQYFLELGEPQRDRVIARRQSYHGNTLGALAAGGNPFRRKQYEPLLVDVSHVSPCYPYRDQRADESPNTYGARLAVELEDEILRLGADRVIAFIAETVCGATLGAVPPVPGYFARVREVCDRHGVLLIFDEVMCGMGRTGTLFASEQEGVIPDIITIGKGLGAGYQPIGAMLCQSKIYDVVINGSGYFQHGHTYSGHAVACAAALAVQQVISKRGLLEHVQILGRDMGARLSERFGDHPHVGDIRGRGFFWAIEMVADRASKKPFPPERRLHAAIKQRALDNGLLCYPMGGTIDGRLGDHVLLAPPYILTSAQLDEMLEKLGRSLDEVLG
ncbi:MAG: aspartate aminotransferase family protein [Proteobacteria bacterium]|nr:aspartate aminotransferase family protein [Pseudomonadota bacterium]